MFAALMRALKSALAPAPHVGRRCRWCAADIEPERAVHPMPLCGPCWDSCEAPGSNPKWTRALEEFPMEFAALLRRYRGGYSEEDARNDAMACVTLALHDATQLQLKAGLLALRGQHDEAEAAQKQAAALRLDSLRIAALYESERRS